MKGTAGVRAKIEETQGVNIISFLKVYACSTHVIQRHVNSCEQYRCQLSFNGHLIMNICEV